MQLTLMLDFFLLTHGIMCAETIVKGDNISNGIADIRAEQEYNPIQTKETDVMTNMPESILTNALNTSGLNKQSINHNDKIASNSKSVLTSENESSLSALDIPTGFTLDLNGGKVSSNINEDECRTLSFKKKDMPIKTAERHRISVHLIRNKKGEWLLDTENEESKKKSSFLHGMDNDNIITLSSETEIDEDNVS